MISPFGIDHGEISKAIPNPLGKNVKLKHANQVANQMRKVGGQQGFKTKGIQLRQAKAEAGAKFQNRPWGV